MLNQINEISAFLLSDHPAARRERLRRRVSRHAAAHARSFAHDWRALTDPASADPETIERLRWLVDDDLQVLRLRLRFEEMVRDHVDPAYRFPPGGNGMAAIPGGWEPDLQALYPGPAGRAALRALDAAVMAGRLTAEQADQQRWERIVGAAGELAPGVAAELLYVPSDAADGVKLARWTAADHASRGIALHQQLHALGPDAGEQFDRLTDRMNWYTAAGRVLADAAEHRQQQDRHHVLGGAADAHTLAALLRAQRTAPEPAGQGSDAAWRYGLHAMAEYLPAATLHRHVYEAVELIGACPPDVSQQLACARHAQQDLRAAQATAASPPGRPTRGWRRQRQPDQPSRGPNPRPGPGRQGAVDHRLEAIAEQVAELERRQQTRERWFLEHHGALLTGWAAAQELQTRTSRLWLDLLQAPPPYLAARLGLPPTDAEGRAAWLHAAQAIERYRAECGVHDLLHPVGPRPANLPQRVLRAQALQALRQARLTLTRPRPGVHLPPAAAAGIER